MNYITELVNKNLEKLIVFGKKLTQHHKNVIINDIASPMCVDFLKWIHINGYLPDAHVDYTMRTWSKRGFGEQSFTCKQLYLRYEIEKQIIKL